MIAEEAKIDKNGYLYIKRAEKLKDQYCKYLSGIKCSDVCVMFGEPKIHPERHGGGFTLRLGCMPEGVWWTFKKFTDERRDQDDI